MFEGQAPRFVSAAEITRNFGMWQDRAGQGPLVVTHHGRPRCVLLSAESYRAIAEGGALDEVGGEAARHGITYALLAERIDAGLVELDADLTITRANGVAGLLLRRAAEHLVGRAIAEAAPTLGTGFPGARIGRAARDGEEARFDCLMDDGTGVSVHVFPWPGGAALLLRRAGAAEAAERAMAEAGARDAALAAHGGLGQMRLTVRGTIAEVDYAFAALAGFERARLTGVRAADLMALSARVALADAIERVLSGGGPEALDTRLLVNGGDERAVRVGIAPVPDGLAVGGAAIAVTPV
ncbi:type II toxin-antitoxin system prevent-host-death family antitoxin [Sphingomonas sp.]|uniref:type II toxin-antitoxin system prevent-host-death family antitoxin n=1 Tax=Sphingomonas sp. TaxID=28214 RepID=UPI003AFF940F